MRSASKVDIWNLALDRIGETDGVESEDEDASRPAVAVCQRHYDNLLKELLEAIEWPWAIRQAAIAEIGEQSETYAGDSAEVDFAVPFAFVDTTQLVVTLIAASGTETVQTAVTHYTITLAADGSVASITMVTAPATGASLRVTVTTTRVGWDFIYGLPADCVTALALLYEDTRHALVPAKSQNEFAVMLNDSEDGYLLCCNAEIDIEFVKLEYVAIVDNVAAMPRHFVSALAWRLAEELAYAIPKDWNKAAMCRKQYDLALSAASAQAMNAAGHDSAEAITPSILARG